MAERVSCLVTCRTAWTVAYVSRIGTACANMLYTLVHEYSVAGCRGALSGTTDQQIALQHSPGAGMAFHLDMSKVSLILLRGCWQLRSGHDLARTDAPAEHKSAHIRPPPSFDRFSPCAAVSIAVWLAWHALVAVWYRCSKSLAKVMALWPKAAPATAANEALTMRQNIYCLIVKLHVPSVRRLYGLMTFIRMSASLRLAFCKGTCIAPNLLQALLDLH